MVGFFNVFKKTPVEIKRDPFPRRAVGRSGTEIYAGRFYEDYLTLIRSYDGAKLYDEMRRSDPQIAMLLSVIKNPIRSATWTIESAGDEEEDQEKADFVYHCLFDNMGDPKTGKFKTFSKFLNEALTYIEFGFSIFEITHKIVRDHPKFGNYIGIRDLGFRSQKTITEWNLRENGSLDSVTQLVNGDLQVYTQIAGEHLLVLSNEMEGDNYEGISMIRPCYGNFLRKNEYRKFQVIGLEKSSTGIPYGEMSEDFQLQNDSDEQLNNFLEMLQSFTSHQSMSLVAPAGFKIGEIKITHDSEKIQKVIDSENMEMTKRFLANFMELGMSSQRGSYSLGSDLSDLFLSGIEYIAKNICENVNHALIKKLVDAKFGPQESYPKLVARGINDKAGRELAEIIGILHDRGLVQTSDRLIEFLHDSYDLPDPDFDNIETITPDGDIETIDDTAPSPDSPVSLALSEAREKVFAEISTIPPKKAQENAKRGLELRNQYGRGGTSVGVARARDIKNASSLSRDTIARMSAFARHRKNYRPEIKEDDGGPTAGTIAWLLWGGSEGVEWAGRTLEKLDKSFDEKILADPRIENKRPSVFIKRESQDVADRMRDFLTESRDNMTGSLRKILVSDNSIQKKRKSALELKMPNAKEYKKYVVSIVGDIGKKAQRSALEEVGKREMNLSEEDFNGLPKKSRDRLIEEIQLTLGYQFADIEKIVYFVVNDELDKGTPPDQILKDILEQSDKYISSGVVDVAATNLLSKTVNGVRNDVFQIPEVMDDIESFIFVNHNPKSDICKMLSGRVFSKEEYMTTPYLPPLHHNCKSVIQAQTKGNKGNKTVSKMGLSLVGTEDEIEKALKSKTI